MPSSFAARAVGRAAGHVPGLKRLPVLRLIAVGEVALLAQQHVMRLTREERHRLLELMRIGRGRPRNLSESDRAELAELVAKLEPRLLAGTAVEKLSPVPLPRRLVYGRRTRRR